MSARVHDNSQLYIPFKIFEYGVFGGVRPLRISMIELATLLSESPDSLRCHGAFLNIFREILIVTLASLSVVVEPHPR